MNPRVFDKTVPIHIWKNAIKQARRSTLHTFKTGAILFDSRSYEIIDSGCSYYHGADLIKPTVHAEEEALRYYRGGRTAKGLSMFIATIGKAGNLAYSSRPCGACAFRMWEAEVDKVFYPERINSGEWVINVNEPKTLYKRFRSKETAAVGGFARGMRIAA